MAKMPPFLDTLACRLRALFHRLFQGSDQEACVPREVIEFQPDAVEIEQAPIPGGARWTLRLLALLVLLALAWSVLARVDRVVTAQGKLVSTGKTLVLQPLSAGMITDILVEEGQEVHAGQVLITMDPTFAEADVEQLQGQLASLESQAERLAAELEGRAGELEGDALQSEILKQRQQEYASRLDYYDKNISRLEAAINTKTGQLEQSRRQLALARDVERMHQEVYEQGASAKVELLKAQSERIKLEELVQRLGNELLEQEEELARLAAERDAFVSNWGSTAAQQLVETNREIEQLRQQLEKARLVSEMVGLKAPKHAVVLQLATRSVGSVVEQGETLVTLVPLDDPLEGEVHIQARDIGYVREGDPVRLKLEAFPFQKHGTLEGKVVSISEDAFQQEVPGGVVVTYKARVSITNAQLEKVPQDFRLIPGMTLAAEIRVGERRVIDYFLYPIIRSLDETIREP